jgi:hypothetical protein
MLSRNVLALKGGETNKVEGFGEEDCMVTAIDSMSSGENESQDTLNLMEWESEPRKKKNLQKKNHL